MNSSDLVESFRADMLLRGYRPKTILAYGRCVRNYIAFSNGKQTTFSISHAKSFHYRCPSYLDAGDALSPSSALHCHRRWLVF